MKKWIIIGIIAMVVLLTGVSVYAYSAVRAPLTEGYEQARQTILDSGELQSVADVSYFHGEDSFFVVMGLDAEGDQAIAWVPQDQEDSTTVLKESDGITPEEAQSITESAVNASKIQSVKLGKEGNTALYEVKYLTESNQQGYYYLTFQDGSFIKRYSLNND